MSSLISGRLSGALDHLVAPVLFVLKRVHQAGHVALFVEELNEGFGLRVWLEDRLGWRNPEA
jgi:hypothetical protein